jgi:hypothetical protein
MRLRAGELGIGTRRDKLTLIETDYKEKDLYVVPSTACSQT